MKKYIYALADPHTKEIRYIGCSKNVSNRYSKHCNCTQIENPHKYKWIEELRRTYDRPILILLEEFDEVQENEAKATETKWILFYKDKVRLTNVRMPDGRPISEELRSKTMALKTKRLHQNKEIEIKLTKEIKTKADRTIKYLSKEYLGLPKLAQRFAEPHILYNGFYTFGLVGKTTLKILIIR